MCTNFRPTHAQRVLERLGLPVPDFEWPDEAWPGYLSPMLIEGLAWRKAMFGLVPYFAKDTKTSRAMYNARSETADSKPSYRGPWRRRQLALIPMDSFFEPNYESGKPIRWRIERHDREPFTVAALWDTWKAKDQPDAPVLFSFSMLTINADGHPVMGRFHAPGDEKRSLVIVPANRREEWLSASDPRQLLLPMPADEFTCQADPLPPRKPKPLLEPASLPSAGNTPPAQPSLLTDQALLLDPESMPEPAPGRGPVNTTVVPAPQTRKPSG